MSWEGPTVQTIFYQGMNSSQVQASKYTGERGFKATTGETVTCDFAFDVIQDVFIAQEIEEVELLDKTKSYGIFTKIQHWFFALFIWWNSIKVSPSPGNLSVSTHAINRHKVSMGQDSDILDHQKKVKILEDAYGPVAKILFGVSRGAATTFSAFARHKYSGVKLVVLEGCPYSVHEVFQKRYGSWEEMMYRRAKHMFPSYDPLGPTPANMIDEFPEGVPVAFITSETDTSVHPQSTIKLARELAKRGRNEVYLLVLGNSSHPNYMHSNKADTNTYRFFLHTLYEKYKLPFIRTFADSTRNILSLTLIRE